MSSLDINLAMTVMLFRLVTEQRSALARTAKETMAFIIKKKRYKFQVMLKCTV